LIYPDDQEKAQIGNVISILGTEQIKVKVSNRKHLSAATKTDHIGTLQDLGGRCSQRRTTEIVIHGVK
jgi:hypothetical protein